MTLANLYREIEALGGSDECADDEAYNDAIADALAVLRKHGFGVDLAPGPQWQPIESAPISNGSNRFIAYITGHGCAVCYAGAGRFIYNASGRRVHRAPHWMPLPSPPEAEA